MNVCGKVITLAHDFAADINIIIYFTSIFNQLDYNWFFIYEVFGPGRLYSAIV